MDKLKHKTINYNTTKSKRRKANSSETIRQQQDILYSNPHSKCIDIMTIHALYQRSNIPSEM